MKRKIFLIIMVFLFNVLWVKALDVTNNLASQYNIIIRTTNTTKSNNNIPSIIDEIDVMTNTNLKYENESAEVIGKKIDLHLKDNMKGYGTLISKYSIVNDVNPYLIASIILESTNCDEKCSVLVTKCNNVYEAYYDKDNISQASCFGGYYQKFDTIDSSIKSFIKYIKVNYYDYDLKSPNSMQNKYKKDVRWVFIVSQYMESIKNSSIN